MIFNVQTIQLVSIHALLYEVHACNCLYSVILNLYSLTKSFIRSYSAVRVTETMGIKAGIKQHKQVIDPT